MAGCRRSSRATVAPAAFVAALLLLSSMPHCGRADMTCEEVESSLTPCIVYLLIGWGPSSACCDGVRSIAEAAGTPEQRRAVCSCAKEAAGVDLPPSVQDRANGIPAKCGVSLPIELGPGMNCSTIV